MGNQFKNAAIIACLKTLLLVFNVIFWLSGILLMAIGVWAELELYKYIDMSPDFSGTGPLVVVGIGGLNFIISTLAFSSIIKGQPVLINIYGGLLAAIFALIVGFFASVVFYRDSLDKGLKNGLTKTLSNSENKDFDEMQANFGCCGVFNFTDWLRSSPLRVIPSSCCINLYRCITANYSDIYNKGCYEVLIDFAEKHGDALFGFGVSAAVFPLAGTIMSWILAAFVKASRYDELNVIVS